MVGPRAAQLLCLTSEDRVFNERKSSACEELLKEMQNKLGLLILDDVHECIKAIQERMLEIQCEVSTMPLGSPWSDSDVSN